MKIAYLIIFLLFTNVRVQAQFEKWWESNRPEKVFFDAMLQAKKDVFQEEFEYPILLILSEEEKKTYRKIKTIHNKRNYIVKYIKEHNENPLLPVNYWLLEFIGRYKKARKDYSSKKSPYFDVRGEYYIKYGKPVRKYIDKGGAKFIQAPLIYSRPSFTVRPNESWYFANDINRFIVHFAKYKDWKRIHRLEDLLHGTQRKKVIQWAMLVIERDSFAPMYGWLSDEILHLLDEVTTQDYSGRISITNEYKMYRKNAVGQMEKKPGAGIAHTTLSTEMYYANNIERHYESNASPNVSTNFSQLNKLEFDYSVTQFKNLDGRTKIDLQFMTPVQNINQYHQIKLDTVYAEYQFMIRDENYTPLLKVPVNAAFPREKAEEGRLTNALCSVSFPIKPIRGDLTVQVKDPISMVMGFKKVPFNVRDFAGDSLMVSDIQFYMEPINEAQIELLPVTDTGQLKIVPYPFKEVNGNLPLICYFEVYNLLKSYISNEYNIDIAVTKIELSLFEKLKKLLRRSESYSTGIRLMRVVTDNDSSEIVAFDISMLKNGRYILEVRITDSQDENRTAKVQRIVDIERF